MKLGKCPGCQQWRVLVNVRRCNCGERHAGPATAYSRCQSSSVQQVFRRHGTCPRTPPLTIRPLEESSV